MDRAESSTLDHQPVFGLQLHIECTESLRSGPRGFRGKGVSRRSLHTQCPGPDLTIISAEGVLPEASHLEDRKLNFLPGRYIDNTEDLGVKISIYTQQGR